MITRQIVTLSVERSESGEFLLRGAYAPNEPVHPLHLRAFLFAWHARSAYGTFLEERWVGKDPCLVLPPADAIDWLSEPATLRHMSFKWDVRSEPLRLAARLLRAALHEGRFAPTLPLDGKGGPVWSLLPPGQAAGGADRAHKGIAGDGDVAGSDSGATFAAGDQGAAETAAALAPDTASAALLEEWLTAAIHQLLHEPGAPRDAWDRLLEAHPDAAPLGDPAGRSAVAVSDADEWLVHIGYARDVTPFRVGLRLDEAADDDACWMLRPLLVDREDDRRMCMCTAEGRPLPGEELPPEWLVHLPSVLERQIGKLRDIWPEFAWELDDGQAWAFLGEIGPRLRERGFAVFLPRWWEELLKRKPKLYSQLRQENAHEPMLGLEHLVRFDWRIAIGDVELDEADFYRLVASNRRLVRIGEQWIALHPQWVRAFSAILKRYGKRDGLRLSEVLELHLLQGVEETVELLPPGEADGRSEGEAAANTGEPSGGNITTVPVRIEVRLNEHLRQLFARLSETAGSAAATPPDHLAGVLRPYQAEGMNWLLMLRKCGFGACLADDMGLGKTVQFIAYLAKLKENRELTRPALLICPTSVLGNWQKELRRFAPELSVHLHYGHNRKRGDDFLAAASGCDLVITSYALGQLDYDALSGIAWSAICLDEAQNIKNPLGKQSKAIRRLEGVHRIALTGTPVENRLSELWSIFDFINPGYLGSLTRFQQRYARAIERGRDADRAGQLQRIIRPFLLRRAKKDPSIRLNLPDKHESKTWVSLTAEQASLYEQVIRDMLARIDRLSAMERKGLILSSLTRLKQICDHPALYLKEAGFGKRQGRDAAGRSRDGAAESARRKPVTRSGKLRRLLEMVDEVRQEGERCLVFTQFVGMGEMLAHILAEQFGETVQFLHGGVPKERRDRMVARFQNTALPADEACGIFVLSLKAGGTGLNLTAANHVFHFDRWWNPAVEDQATDRAYRIGQSKDVQVHKFVTLGTLEERIDEMIERKQELRRQFAGSGENWITELSTEELKDLFALRRDWVEA